MLMTFKSKVDSVLLCADDQDAESKIEDGAEDFIRGNESNGEAKFQTQSSTYPQILAQHFSFNLFKLFLSWLRLIQ